MNSIEYLNKGYWMEKRHPYACGIELTPNCNMRCIHCYLQDSRSINYLSTEQIIRILDILYESQLLLVYFMGGEILTRPDFLEIYLYAKKKGFIVELLSNATLIDDKTVEVFDKYPPALVSISIYGASEKTYYSVTNTNGNYIKAIEGIQRLASANINFEIKFIALKENIQDFYEVKAIAEKYKVEFKESFELFSTLQRSNLPLRHMLSPEEIVSFEKEYSVTVSRWASQCRASIPLKNPPLFFCDIARSSFIIDCEGYMEPCNKLRLRKYNILEIPFSDIWKIFSQYKSIPAPASYRCPSCVYRVVCMPCPAENRLVSGNFTEPPEHTCKLAELRFKEFSKGQYAPYRENYFRKEG